MFGLDDAAIAAMIAAAEAAAAEGAAAAGTAATSGAASGAAGAGMGAAAQGATAAAMESAAMPAMEAGAEGMGAMGGESMGSFSEYMGDDMGMLMDDPQLSPYEMPSQPQPGVEQQTLSSPADASGAPASNNPMGKAPTPDSMMKMPDMLNSMADQMLFGRKAPPPTHAKMPEQQRRPYQPTTMRMQQKKRRY